MRFSTCMSNTLCTLSRSKGPWYLKIVDTRAQEPDSHLSSSRVHDRISNAAQRLRTRATILMRAPFSILRPHEFAVVRERTSRIDLSLIFLHMLCHCVSLGNSRLARGLDQFGWSDFLISVTSIAPFTARLKSTSGTQPHFESGPHVGLHVPWLESVQCSVHATILVFLGQFRKPPEARKEEVADDLATKPQAVMDSPLKPRRWIWPSQCTAASRFLKISAWAWV